VDGFQLHYLQVGAGPSLVLLHGLGASVYSWRYLLAEPQRFKKVAVLAPAVDPSLVSPWIRNLPGTIPLVRCALNRFTMKRILAKIVAHQELINPGSVSAYLEPYLDRGQPKAGLSEVLAAAGYRLICDLVVIAEDPRHPEAGRRPENPDRVGRARRRRRAPPSAPWPRRWGKAEIAAAGLGW
jgi:pimeloyl-ACP methyl ester carboxylesterase